MNSRGGGTCKLGTGLQTCRILLELLIIYEVPGTSFTSLSKTACKVDVKMTSKTEQIRYQRISTDTLKIHVFMDHPMWICKHLPTFWNVTAANSSKTVLNHLLVHMESFPRKTLSLKKKCTNRKLGRITKQRRQSKSARRSTDANQNQHVEVLTNTARFMSSK